MAATATVSSLLIAATLLGLFSRTNVVHCKNVHLDCSVLHPLTLGCMKDAPCKINPNPGVANCTKHCKSLNYMVGAYSTLDKCTCSNETDFDLIYCCSHLQCYIACDARSIYCNPTTHRCEYYVPSTSTSICKDVCNGKGFYSYAVSATGDCTCTDCSGSLNASPDTCARVSSGLWGVSSETTGRGTCKINANAPVDPSDMVYHVNAMDKAKLIQ